MKPTLAILSILCALLAAYGVGYESGWDDGTETGERWGEMLERGRWEQGGCSQGQVDYLWL